MELLCKTFLSHDGLRSHDLFSKSVLSQIIVQDLGRLQVHNWKQDVTMDTEKHERSGRQNGKICACSPNTPPSATMPNFGLVSVFRVQRSTYRTCTIETRTASKAVHTGLPCHCRHQGSLADGGHVFVSRDTSLDDVHIATRILASAPCCDVTVTGLRAYVFFLGRKRRRYP